MACENNFPSDATHGVGVKAPPSTEGTPLPCTHDLDCDTCKECDILSGDCIKVTGLDYYGNDCCKGVLLPNETYSCCNLNGKLVVVMDGCGFNCCEDTFCNDLEECAGATLLNDTAMCIAISAGGLSNMRAAQPLIVDPWSLLQLNTYSANDLVDLNFTIVPDISSNNSQYDSSYAGENSNIIDALSINTAISGNFISEPQTIDISASNIVINNIFAYGFGGNEPNSNIIDALSINTAISGNFISEPQTIDISASGIFIDNIFSYGFGYNEPNSNIIDALSINTAISGNFISEESSIELEKTAIGVLVWP